MIRIFLTASIAAFACAGPALADGAAETDAPEIAVAPIVVPPIEYEVWQLENGLTVIALPDDTTSTVTTSMWYAVGSKHDPAGRSGLSHLVEHVVSRESENLPAHSITALVADIGGTRNASVWVDRTNFFEQVPAQYLETMLWTHRERMARVVLDAAVFETERSVVREELRERVLARPYGRLERFVIPENAYTLPAYRRPGIGSIADLDAVTLAEARAFYDAHYGPDTATLIVAGNFDTVFLRAMVDRYFGDIPARTQQQPAPGATPAEARSVPRAISATAPVVPLPVVGGIWPAPPASHPDAAALEVLEAILSRGDNSRLASALVRPGLAVRGIADFQLFRDAGQIALYAVLHDQSRIPEASASLDAQVDRLRAEVPSTREVREAQNEIIAGILRGRETARGRAFELGEGLMASGDPDFANMRLARIRAVTPDDVRRAAARYLDPQQQVRFTYTQGDDDAREHANQERLPDPASVRSEAQVLRQGRALPAREAPPVPGEAPEFAAPRITTARLAGGIEVIVAETGGSPIATLAMVMPGGTSTDAILRPGTAQMAAQLADSGMFGWDAAAIAARFEELGARFSGRATPDATVFTLTAPLATLGEASELAAAIVRGALYPDVQWQRERDRALAGLRPSGVEPGGLAAEVMQAVAYGPAPYGTVPYGTPESLAAMTRDDLLFHRQLYYHPARMKIVFTGGIAPDAALALAEGMFADWQVPTRPGPLPDDPAGPAPSPRTIVIDMPGAEQALVAVAVRAPPRSSADYHALVLANAVLGGGPEGRLFEQIRTVRGLSYGAYSRLDERRGEALLLARAQTSNAAAAQVAGIILDEFGRLGTEPLPHDLLDARRRTLAGARARDMETSSAMSAILTTIAAQGIDPHEVIDYQHTLADIDPEAVREAARRTLDPARASIVIVGDADQFLDELGELRSDIEVIPFDELDLLSPSLRRATDQELQPPPQQREEQLGPPAGPRTLLP